MNERMKDQMKVVALDALRAAGEATVEEVGDFLNTVMSNDAKTGLISVLDKFTKKLADTVNENQKTKKT